VVTLPLLVLAILKGGPWLFLLLAAVICVGALWELLALLVPESRPGWRLATCVPALWLLGGFALAPGGLGGAGPLWPLVFLTGALFLLMAGHLATYGRAGALAEMGFQALALLYLPFLLGHLVWLRLLSGGEWWVLWLLAVIFAGDTAAYYTGRSFGRHRLSPRVSPGKTWEGTAGGLAASLLAGVAAGVGLLPEAPLRLLAPLALTLGGVGVLGDLFESMLKRLAQVKDAGSLLPGHGGLLDRLDSLLFAGPVVLYARLLVFGP